MLKKQNLMKNLGLPLRGEGGFTLTEMLIVVAIIGMIAAFVGSQLISKFTESKVNGTKIQMKQLAQTLDQFRIDCGFYPTTEQGLDALANKPSGGRECKNYDPEGYMKKVPKDSFGFDFIYESDGRTYTLRSLGDDGAEGGDGTAADIDNKDL